MSDLEVHFITDMAAIHQTQASFFFFFSLLHILPPLCSPLPLSLSVNTTLQLLTLNSGGDKNQPWPSHLQCYSLERKHTNSCTHTYKCQAVPPPRNIHRPAAAKRASTTFYLVFLGLDEQFGRGDARLVRRDLVLEEGGRQRDNAATFTVSIYTSIHKHSSSFV